ncbi:MULTISPECIES: SRPBCC family protein [Rhodococcus]|uniref:Polyketide cyclase n=2 Tax=Rhodococcus opacus TaxID=37919 RepID=C1BC40_RHOOB|nr:MULTISPECIES: SRPBCC family protein [Rhodococcus]EID75077.1 hypothetical protein W59_28410 [Rhodococcus opacus RKJ300 = JCM 13270]KAF0957533.1 hypothetical protein MLGJGCBP_09365 [Rhodococcus sp. T7]KAF0964498.1 hypothetical protein MLGJGCBP_02366 [Rhodococcus sp. T7]QQZ19155.1 SRPBCC family protein [Rhodococcus sp. 21391]BAH55622.1 hypothetical protein ROP_pROB01-01230 [Rhodococcus opacus B4]
MIVAEESVVIDRPIEEVFTFIQDPGNVTLFMTNVISYELVSGQAGEVGSVVHGVVEVAGRQLEITEELTDIEQGKYLRRRGTDSPVPYETETLFESTDRGTRVTYHQESGSLGGIFGALADGIVAKLYARDVRSNLEHARTLLEAGDPQ